MKALKIILLCGALALSGVADAKGGSSSGGGGHASSGGGRSSSGGFSSGGSRPSSAGPATAPRPNSAPSIAPNTTNTARPDSKPSIAPNANSTTVKKPGTSTTTTTTSTSTTYSSRYVSPGGSFGGWGMGYGYTNGLLTGMIIANLMHPHHTVMYVGPGAYNNNALLYPDGRVVNQQGYQVGTYANGQFTPVQNGAMVAQQVPSDAGAQYQSSTQPVVLQKAGPSGWEIAGMVVLGIVCVLLFLFILGVF